MRTWRKPSHAGSTNFPPSVAAPNLFRKKEEEGSTKEILTPEPTSRGRIVVPGDLYLLDDRVTELPLFLYI